MESLRGIPPWKDKNLTWLGDPRRYDLRQMAYRMPGGRKILYDSVLNHRILEAELEPGYRYEGMLAAFSIQTRISTDYLHGECFPMRLALIDQLR